MPDKNTELPSELKKVRLRDIACSKRSEQLLKLETYYHCTQHEGKKFDWDGSFLRYGESTDIKYDGYIPHKNRRPSVRMDLPKVIVDRLTAMIFGTERFPNIRVEGDPEAEDFAQEISRQSKLGIKMIEARSIGGATGAVALSWGFKHGKPRIEVHSPAYIEILDWEDFEEKKPAKVLKSYSYSKTIWDNDGKPMVVTLYYARYWDQYQDIIWKDIPEEVANTSDWTEHSKTVVHHGTGSCPVYWVQNWPKSNDIDGISDYDRQDSKFDQIDILLSATSRGTVANVDPTLVIHDDRRDSDAIRKGSDYAIYSRYGASYLELQGSSIQASRELIKDLRQYALDVASVVLLDPEKMSGAGISAAAMKTRYAAMTAKCDVLREQYGAAIIGILTSMLKEARKLRMVKKTEKGIEYWYVDLPPRIVYDDKQTSRAVLRTPGTSSNITLQWAPYFPTTWQDRKEAVEAAKAATGNRQILSQRQAIKVSGPLWGVSDVDQELSEIEADQERGIHAAHRVISSEEFFTSSKNVEQVEDKKNE